MDDITLEYRAAMQELLDANRARVRAYGNRDALNQAIARIEVATRKAEALLAQTDKVPGSMSEGKITFRDFLTDRT